MQPPNGAGAPGRVGHPDRTRGSDGRPWGRCRQGSSRGRGAGATHGSTAIEAQQLASHVEHGARAVIFWTGAMPPQANRRFTRGPAGKPGWKAPSFPCKTASSASAGATKTERSGFSNKSAETRDRTTDDQAVDLFGALVRVEGLGVGDEPRDVVRQKASRFRRGAREPGSLPRGTRWCKRPSPAMRARPAAGPRPASGSAGRPSSASPSAG